MPDFKLSLTAKPPKPKPRKPGKQVVVHAGGRGGSGNIIRTKELVNQPSSNSLARVKSNSTTFTTATAATSHSSRTFSSAKSLSSVHSDYGCTIGSPAGREVGLPRNKTTTSGRGGLGNAHDHVLENGVFERVLAFEDAVIRSHREVKAARRTGRGGAGNIKASKGDKYGSLSKRSFLAPSLKSKSTSTKSSETSSRELARVETQISVQTTDSNGVPLSMSSLSDQVSESLQGGGKGNNEEAGGRIGTRVPAIARIPNSSRRNFSRPMRPEVVEARRSPFRPSPESWANATTEALAHLEATGVISDVPDVPDVPEVPKVQKSAQARSFPIIGTISSSPVPPNRGAENVLEISANSHFKRVAPGVSLYSPSPSEQAGLIPPSQQFQVEQPSKQVRTPSDGSTELPYRRTREKKQTHQRRNVTLYSPTLSPDYLARNEDDEQKPAQPRAPSQPYRAEDTPCHSINGHADPLDDLPRYAAQSPPIPGSTAAPSPHTLHLSASKTHEKQGSLASDDTILNLACYAFPMVPTPRLVQMLPALQYSPQNRRMKELVASIEADIQQSRWDCERRRDDYPLNPPPYGTTHSPGREPINTGALYRSQRHQAERGFPGTPSHDPSADEMSSSPAPASSPSTGTTYSPQDPRASPAPWRRLGEHRTFSPSPISSESRPMSPAIDPTQLQNYRDGDTADRRLGAPPEDVPQDRQLLSAGHSSGRNRRPTTEHVGRDLLRRVRSRDRDLSLRELSLPAKSPPSVPLPRHPDGHGSPYHGNSEPRQAGAFGDRYLSNYGSHPARRSPTATATTQHDGRSAAASTVRSPSQLSTVNNPQDEPHDRTVDIVSGHTQHAEDDRASCPAVRGEFQYEEGVTSDQDLKVRGRGTVEAAQSTGPGTPVPNHPSNLTNTTTTVLKEVNVTQVPQTVVAPLIRPAGSMRNPNAEDEAPLHIDELNVPSRKPLSRMEKALLRRVEFGSHVDYTNLQVT